MGNVIFPPQRTSRQFPRYEEIGTPEERRQVVIHLHAQGWSISTIARYLDVSRPTIYAILKRWISASYWRVPQPKAHAQALGTIVRQLLPNQVLDAPGMEDG